MDLGPDKPPLPLTEDKPHDIGGTYSLARSPKIATNASVKSPVEIPLR
jgi:hypothetical protein